MKTFSCLIAILFNLIFSSCYAPESENKFEEYLKFSSLSSENYDYVLIIPRAGCGGCISKAEIFFLEYQKKSNRSKRIAFIFTKFDSKKLLRLKFGREIIERKNVIFDKENTISSHLSYDDQYPVLIKFKIFGIDVVQESDKSSFIKELSAETEI
jgi:hypothetical protein